MALTDWFPEEIARDTASAEKRKQIDRDRCKAYQARKRLEVIRKLGGKCNQCDETDPQMLHLDEHDKTKSWSRRYNAILKDDAPGRLLCAGCNWKKRQTHGEATGRPRG